ncbi:MAG: 1-deoxy-D-xylulose 5-phosphate reductoisomerase [candidate division Zixibacteria bacterium SM1_73]|nr:MAG: 1-deoxy-D-xylulose 5-phosphate reductoisomerase [candidate division Zixibacteria bacterium SM1_73]
MKNVVVLGSTGSIGRNTLSVLSDFADRFKVFGFSTNTNTDLLQKQIQRFQPQMVAITDRKGFEAFQKTDETEILFGIAGLKKLCSEPEVDLVINALVGSVGLLPSFEAVESGKDLAIANKETLVIAGGLLIRKAKEKNVRILPIDSEHSAILQCLLTGKKEEVRRLILTASGGPFLDRKKEDLKNIKVKEALSHPTWEMGKKITVDSATLMNKGLEVIEAHWLFDMPADKIRILIHPQSIIHSMVEFVDGSLIAQMSVPDMKIPIQYALFCPERLPTNNRPLDLTQVKNLTFEEPDQEKFPCLEICYQALEMGGTAPAVLNAANELAVKAFLEEKISFVDICEIVTATLKHHQVMENPSLDDILNADKWSRQEAERIINSRSEVGM